MSQWKQQSGVKRNRNVKAVSVLFEKTSKISYKINTNYEKKVIYIIFIANIKL